MIRLLQRFWRAIKREFLLGDIVAYEERLAAIEAHGLEHYDQESVEELRGLLARMDGWELPSMSGLGYREFQPYFAGQSSLDEAIQRLKYDTHAFARRQPNWFRRLPAVEQLPADEPDLLEQALLVCTELSAS